MYFKIKTVENYWSNRFSKIVYAQTLETEIIRFIVSYRTANKRSNENAMIWSNTMGFFLLWERGADITTINTICEVPD